LTAKQAEDQIAAQPNPSDELTAAIVALEAAAIDIFAVFEARMQHHFRRGPFSRKLKVALLEAGETDLADRIYEYYLIVNVLKHGKGASHRELLAMSEPLLPVRKAPEDYEAGDGQPGLVDVTASGFFDGLTTAIIEAHDFLER
jgi:hypothetical protein